MLRRPGAEQDRALGGERVSEAGGSSLGPRRGREEGKLGRP